MTEPNPDRLRALRQNPILSRLAGEALQTLAGAAAMIAPGANQMLFHRGERADRLFVVARGQVDLLLDDSVGNRSRFEAVAAPLGVAFTCAVGGDVYAYSCECSSPNTLLIAIPVGDFVDAISASPAAMKAMLAHSSAHLRRLVGQLSDFRLKGSVQRLAGYLIELSPARHGEAEVVLPTEKQIVADHLGMKPETLSRALGRLHSMGLAHIHDAATLRVPDLSRLRRLYFAGEEGLR